MLQIDFLSKFNIESKCQYYFIIIFRMTTVDTNACRTSPGRMSNASGPRAAGVPPAHDPHPERVSTAFRPHFVLSYL